MRFAKIASNLHTNPKVFTAGRNARDVYVWALCKNAELEGDGVVPASYFEPDFASRMLGCDARDVTDGLARAEASGLIRRTKAGDVALVGWDDEWRPAADGKERTRRWRDAKRAKPAESVAPPVTNSDGGDARDVTESHGDGGDTGEESRGEKRREEGAASPLPADDFEFAEGTDPGLPRKPARKRAAIPMPPGWLPDETAANLAGELGLDLVREAADFRDWTAAKPMHYGDWQAGFRSHLRRQATRAPAARHGPPATSPPRKPDKMLYDGYAIAKEREAAAKANGSGAP